MGFWNNVHGWVYDVRDATFFTSMNYSLPMSAGGDAEWMPVKYESE